MKICAGFAALAMALMLSGCGGSGSTTKPMSASPPVYPSVSGNWSLMAVSQLTSSAIDIGAYLTATDGKMSGILHIVDSACYSLTEDVPISGTITTGGAVSVTSAAVASQVIAVKGTISGANLSSGSYTITGGCAAGDKGTVTGYIVPPFTNAYTGTFALAGGTAATATVVTTQSGPNSDGIYQISGTATFSGSPCLASATITSSMVSGGYFGVSLSASNGTVVDFAGEITNSTGDMIDGEYLFTAGPCAGASGSGTLKHS